MCGRRGLGRSRREHADRRETSRAGKDAEKAEVDGKPAKMGTILTGPVGYLLLISHAHYQNL